MICYFRPCHGVSVNIVHSKALWGGTASISINHWERHTCQWLDFLNLKTFLVNTAGKYTVSVPTLDAFDKKLQLKITWKVMRWLAVYPVHSKIKSHDGVVWQVLQAATGSRQACFYISKPFPFFARAVHTIRSTSLMCFLLSGPTELSTRWHAGMPLPVQMTLAWSVKSSTKSSRDHIREWLRY